MSINVRHTCLAVVLAAFAVVAGAQTSADLQVTKTGPAIADVGDDIPYVVTLTNNGPTSAASVTLSDLIPGGMVFVSLDSTNAPGFNCTAPSPGNPGTIVCTTPLMLSGAAAQFTFVFEIVNAVPGQSFLNEANATSTTPDPNPSNNTGSEETRTPAADAALTKTGPTSAPAGTNVSYTVTVQNFGPDTATNVTITDPIPAGMTFVSATQVNGPAFTPNVPAPGDPGTVIMTGGTLLVGQSAQFTFVFAIPSDAAPGTDFTNIATVSNDTGDPSEENDSSVVVTSTPPPPQGDLRVSKSGPNSTGPGTQFAYTITLTNAGPSAAANVTLTDTLPGDLTFVSLGQTGTMLNCTTPAIGAGGTVQCTAASYPNGASTTLTLTVAVPGDAAAGDEYNNVALVTADNDPNEENNSAGTGLIIAAVEVAVTKGGPANVTAGDNITYTIALSNTGDNATLTLVDQLPAGTTFVSMTKDSGPASSPCSTPPPGQHGTVTCNITLGTLQTANYTLVVNATGTNLNLTNTAIADPELYDTNETNNTSSVMTTVTPVADLGVVKTGPSPVTAGTSATYTITVTNNGPSTASTVTLMDMVPANTTLVSFGQTAGPAFNCNAPAPGGTGLISCDIASLAANTPATFSLTVLVSPSATGSISNTAQVDTTTSDPTASNDQSTVVSTVVASANLSAVKAGPPSVTAGTNVTYTVTINNAGPSDAQNVTLTDTVPANTTFVSAMQNSGPLFTCNNAISCSRATLPLGASASFTFVFAVPASATGSVTNTAQIGSTTTDPVSNDNTSTVVTPIATSADLSAIKNGPATVAAGTNITYDVTVSNAGPSNAANVTLSDLVPANASYVSVTQNSGPAFTCNSTISCTIATFAPGASANFTIVFAVSPSAAGSITNTAQIASPTTDPASGNNTSTVVTPVTTSADLSVVKTGPATVTAGANATYTVTVANAGPADALNVVLTDTPPPGAAFVSVTQNSGPTFTCTGTSCSIASFPAGATASFTFVFMAPANAISPIDNTATITSATSDPDPTDNTSTTTANVEPGTTDLSITKTASVDRAGIGSPVTYTITVTNNGPAFAFGTTVTDEIPAGTTFVSATPSQGSCTGTTTVICTLGTLAPSSSATIALTVMMPRNPASISNTASVTALNADSNAGNNSGTALLAVTAEIPALSTYALLALAMMLGVVGLMKMR